MGVASSTCPNGVTVRRPVNVVILLWVIQRQQSIQTDSPTAVVYSLNPSSLWANLVWSIHQRSQFALSARVPSATFMAIDKGTPWRQVDPRDLQWLSKIPAPSSHSHSIAINTYTQLLEVFSCFAHILTILFHHPIECIPVIETYHLHLHAQHQHSPTTNSSAVRDISDLFISSELTHTQVFSSFIHSLPLSTCV